MFLIQNNEATDPAINLALEEYCLLHLGPGSEYLLFFITQPSIIIGRHQNPLQEYNQKLARQKNIFLVRRISGGGAVYHDLGNLNFSFITDFTEEKLDYFKILIKPIVNTLQRLGVAAVLTEKNNILVNGKKISGNSQHTNMRRMLSHGTLLFDSDLEVLQRALQSNLEITDSRAVSSIKSKVTNISYHLPHPIGMEVFQAEIINGVADALGDLTEYQLTAEAWEAVDRLAEEKYRSWEWTFGRSPEFAVRHQFRFDAGNVDARMIVKHGVIRGIEFEMPTIESASVFKGINQLIGQRFDLQGMGNLTVN